MFQKYFKIAWRNLNKNRFSTLVNLSGLTVGIAVSLALLLFVQNEFNFDQYHKHAEQIVRIGLDVEWDNTKEKWASVPNIAGPTFKDKISEVQDQVRLLKHNFGDKAFVSVGQKNFIEKNLYWADSSLLEIFDITLLDGDPKNALNQPNQLMLSRSNAEKIFGTVSPLGKIITIDNNRKLTISAVYEDFPPNSTLDAEMIGSFLTEKWAANNLYWSNCSFETFLLLHPGTSLNHLEQDMAAILDEAVEKDKQWFSFWAQPLTEMHLYSTGITNGGYSSRMSDIRQVRLLIFMAIAILLLACFNYINMSTARSQQRFREVAINKTLGATKEQLILRFFLETGILVALAIFASIVLVQLNLSVFETAIGRSILMPEWQDPQWWTMILGLWAAITLSAGMYPALFLSGFSPKSLLQPSLKGATGKQFFRNTLVIVQFSVCIGLISAALVLNNQLQFISQKKLGFQPEQVIAINAAAAKENQQVESLANAYRNLPFVQQLCRAQGFPGKTVSGFSMTKPGQDNISIGVSSNSTQAGFEEVLDLQFIAGKTLPNKLPDDTTVQVVINEAALKFLGWSPEEAIGKSPPNLFSWPTTIVGVVKDFHHESMHNPITPYVFNNGNSFNSKRTILVKLKSGELQSNLKQLEQVFSKHLPTSAFDFTFLDDYTRRLYANESRLSRVVMFFTALAIFVSCLGLFGLAAFTVERRTKEIGIRKVLGATTQGLVSLLTKEFMKPVFWSILLATPLAFFAMNQWLDNFAYRIELSWWIFVFSGGIAALVALMTVSFQSIRAAIANPADSLKDE